MIRGSLSDLDRVILSRIHAEGRIRLYLLCEAFQDVSVSSMYTRMLRFRRLGLVRIEKTGPRCTMICAVEKIGEEATA